VIYNRRNLKRKMQMALQDMAFDHREFQTSSADERLYVKFYRDTLPDDVETKKQGRPIFKEVDYVMIQTPGDLLKTVKRPVRPDDQRRFPRLWDAYANGKDQDDLVGTPLAQWPGISRAQVEELAFFKVKTVEQLATVPDNILQKFMGLTSLRQAARDWLGRAENSKEIVQLRNQNTEQAQAIDELKATVRELSQKLQQPAARR
jgi:hypothetical protein